jgi:hypothetical protein
MSNYSVIVNSELRGCRTKQSWPILRYYSDISLEVQRNTKNLGIVG